MDWVVKIGGSLFPHQAIKLAENLKGLDVVVICVCIQYPLHCVA